MILFFRRIYAMILRHIYLFMVSWPRVLELIYWPFLNMVLWAFMSKFLAQNSNIFLLASGVLIASVIMWDTLFRGQLGVTLSFIEELWSRNLGNIAVSPLKPIELILSLIAASLIRTIIGVGGAGLAAYFLFDFQMSKKGDWFAKKNTCWTKKKCEHSKLSNLWHLRSLPTVGHQEKYD